VEKIQFPLKSDKKDEHQYTIFTEFFLDREMFQKNLSRKSKHMLCPVSKIVAFIKCGKIM